ncbi:outer membrane beta-barrel protein [Helicobacter sp. 13S00477-4]|uniref:outer membrane beta-barrel protein n=1 Tax=Helicobacter sp. 13S00477-4 TaxID=1905759 RepID=UPI000BA61A92|nr:outer membrane beta-barrel protein [Helicobacter sp. 13S00477-4]PAF50491.1 hypothetical protein BKH44_08020 [Helicobacter sp. 13S00477-4]
MKKPKLLTTLAILASLVSLSQARFYIGVEGGYVYGNIDKSMEGYTDYKWAGLGTDSTITYIPGCNIKNAYKGYGYLLNLNIGNEYHFDDKDMYGLRWIGAIGYGNTNLVNQANKDINYPSYMLNLSVGMDALFDVIKFDESNSLGFFIGLEGGVNALISNAKIKDSANDHPIIGNMSILLTPRFGASLLLDNHHRIEIMGKIPAYIYNASQNATSKPTYSLTPYEVMLSYKYIF